MAPTCPACGAPMTVCRGPVEALALVEWVAGYYVYLNPPRRLQRVVRWAGCDACDHCEEL